MSVLKTLLTFMVVGAFLGASVTSVTWPRYQSWNNETPYATQTVCDLPKVISEATASLIHAQLWGSAIGAGLMLVLGILWVVSRRKRARARATPPTVA